MIYFIFFAIFFILNTYVFMYQRTTLTIARVIRDRVSNTPITQVQLLLTPNWIGLLGWTSTIGLYGSLILIGWQINVLLAIGILIATHVSHAIIPIPSEYFYELVKKHLHKEQRQQNDKENKDTFAELWTYVDAIGNNYKIS